jgi:hypothetical protein
MTGTQHQEGIRIEFGGRRIKNPRQVRCRCSRSHDPVRLALRQKDAPREQARTAERLKSETRDAEPNGDD